MEAKPAKGSLRWAGALACLIALLLAGCLGDGSSPWDDTPTPAPSELAVAWDDPSDDRNAYGLVWDLTASAARPSDHGGRLASFTWQSPSIEGWDHRLTLRYHLPDEVPARLTHDATLAAPGTFDFSSRSSRSGPEGP